MIQWFPILVKSKFSLKKKSPVNFMHLWCYHISKTNPLPAISALLKCITPFPSQTGTLQGLWKMSACGSMGAISPSSTHAFSFKRVPTSATWSEQSCRKLAAQQHTVLYAQCQWSGPQPGCVQLVFSSPCKQIHTLLQNAITPQLNIGWMKNDLDHC